MELLIPLSKKEVPFVRQIYGSAQESDGMQSRRADGSEHLIA